MEDINQKVTENQEENAYTNLLEKVQTLTDQNEQLANKLLKSHEVMQKEINTQSEEMKSYYEKKITNLQIENQNEQIARENSESKRKDLEKLIKKIKDTAKNELQKAIAKKVAEFDYTSQILELCDKIDDIGGGYLTQLSSICTTLDSVDYVSQQRIYATVLNLRNFIQSIIETCKIQSLFLPEDEVEAFKSEVENMNIGEDYSTIPNSEKVTLGFLEESDDNNQKLQDNNEEGILNNCGNDIE